MQLLRTLALTAFILSLAFSTSVAADGPGTSATPVVTGHSTLRHFTRGLLRRALQPLKRDAPATVYYEAPTLLTGTVVGTDGMPLAGALVWAVGSQEQVRTNSKGDFALTLPTSGPVSLSCASRGCTQQTMQLNTGSQPNGVYFALRAATTQE
ncbi:carboxypeptidase-like regulatory domain-containing protein [Hymenobacter sp. J193]|uniref:carboxypeptidase-like regulatory domain-containing protein n=1 Tax=Hymenobacter sp. J193 TaxID=2898429 RepID=UPI002150F551|nr:carboxypeptidase-like regulatory domain-containing protein [Hymenobacter sp. J193]MCR5886895.1 carboxypeptidase-like regulatory domain-containing protein [Hymenobacter sp. J193]